MFSWIKIKNFFIIITGYIIFMSTVLWMVIPIQLQGFVSFNFLFLIYDIMVGITIYMAIRAPKSKWCREMSYSEKGDYIDTIQIIFATFINILYWDKVSLILLGFIGLK